MLNAKQKLVKAKRVEARRASCPSHGTLIRGAEASAKKGLLATRNIEAYDWSSLDA